MVIAGYVELGKALLAFDLFQNLFQENRAPNGFILYCILKACINIGVVYQGMLIHDLMLRNAIQVKDELGNTLVEMYAKCGCPNEASRVLERLPDRDVASWSALAASYSAQGKCKQIDILLDRMSEDGVKVDDVVFTSLLAGCGHAGLLEKGWKYFKSMRDSHGMHPKPEHYNCLIGLFSRAGNMGKAKDILKTTPSPDFVGCISLLSSCKEHRNLGLARGCYEAAIRLDPFDPSPYLLMANMQGPDCKVSRDGLDDVSAHELVSSCTYPFSINDKHCSAGQDGGLC
jgi:pentatricopeptide repeat protein